jgi:uncharacterized protein
MIRSLKTIATLGIATAVLATVTPAAATDFSCRDARSAAERAICADVRLSKLDDRMATSYGRLWSVSGQRSRLELRDYQHRFLNARNACGWDTRCIREAYMDQISVLDARLVTAQDN